MAEIVFAPGGVVIDPGVPAAGPAGLEQLLHGWDGSVWPLHLQRRGVYLAPGLRGWHMPKFVRPADESVGVAGARARAEARILSRDVRWVLRMWRSPGQAWLDYDAAFWRVLRPGKVNRWEVRQPNGTSRSLLVELSPDWEEDPWDEDPTVTGWATYDIPLIAHDPYWRGDPDIRFWQLETDQEDFVGPSGQGPDFYVAEANPLASATISNLGDAPAFPVWWVVGPTTTVELGVAGDTIEVPFVIEGGRLLVIDTFAETAIEIEMPDSAVGDFDPESTAWQQYVESQLPNGTDRTAELGSYGFRQVDPGEAVQLTLDMVGEGKIAVFVTPPHLLAWG